MGTNKAEQVTFAGVCTHFILSTESASQLMNKGVYPTLVRFSDLQSQVPSNSILSL